MAILFPPAAPTSAALQVAPGIFVSEESANDFLEELDNNPEYLPGLIDLWVAVAQPITADNVDPVIWDVYAPLFQYLNFQRRVLCGDEQALAIAAAVMDITSAQRIRIRHSIQALMPDYRK